MGDEFDDFDVGDFVGYWEDVLVDVVIGEGDFVGGVVVDGDVDEGVFEEFLFD